MKQPFKIIIVPCLEHLKIKKVNKVAKVAEEKVVSNDVEKAFEEWLEKVFFGVDLDAGQVIEMRKAFFCGGFVVLHKLCDFGDLPADIAETKFDNILAEMQTRIEGWAKDGTK